MIEQKRLADELEWEKVEQAKLKGKLEAHKKALAAQKAEQEAKILDEASVKKRKEKYTTETK